MLLQPDPIPASLLADEETRLHRHLATLEPLKYGCDELDDAVLLGGLQRGNIVGISADDDDFGLTMGFQVMIKAILAGSVKQALVITPKPLSQISESLMNITNSELSSTDLCPTSLQQQCRASLDSVMLSAVFDVDGVWQALADLDGLSTARDRTESDTQDRENGGLSQYMSHSNIKSYPKSEKPMSRNENSVGSLTRGSLPQVIVITHFSTLLTSLFARREKNAAHQSISMLKTRLRQSSSSLDSSSLVLLLNSKTSGASEMVHNLKANRNGLGEALTIATEPAIRSVSALAAHESSTRPSFGPIFGRFLDLHIFCTIIPKRGTLPCSCHPHATAATLHCASKHHPVLVEVIRDDIGKAEAMNQNRSRENRWSVLKVVDHRICDACWQ